MDNVKDDSYYVDKLKTDLAFISLHISGKSREDFDADEVLQDSMMFRLIQISENAKKISAEFKVLHGDIPWVDVYGLRNRIVHEYGNVDLSIVYDTLVYDIPDFLRKLNS